MILNRINNRYYNYIDKDTGFIFNFKAGDIGVCSCGKCWRLALVANGVETVIACYTTAADGHNCYRNTTEAKLWTNEDALFEANRTIKRLLHPKTNIVPTAKMNDIISNAIYDIADLSVEKIDIEKNDDYSKLIETVKDSIIEYLTDIGGNFEY